MTIRKILLFLAVFLSFGIFGYKILTTPDNPLIKMLRPPISSVDAKVIMGPYPLEKDLRLLQSHNVKTLISLLNPQLPYEKQLLEQEQVLAKKYGFTLLNFPMSSILGQRFGADYERNAELAAKAAAETPGKVYMHCYLGLHRVKVVEGLFAQYKVVSDNYLARTAERDTQFKLLDEAQAHFDKGDFSSATRSVEAMKNPDVPALLLRGWSQYRLGNDADTMRQFSDILKTNPNNADALAGLGYSALRSDALDDAARYFGEAIKLDSANPEIVAGMGILKYRQGEWAQADEFLRRTLQLNPKHTEARDLLAKLAASGNTSLDNK